MSAGPLAVTGAVLDGETVGLRCEDGRIAALGADVVPVAGDETIDAADALAARGGLADRGKARLIAALSCPAHA